MYLSKVKLPRLVPLPVMATYLVFQLQHRVFTSSHLFCPVDSSASVLVSILFEKKTYKVRKKYVCILDKEQLSGVCFTGLLFALFCPKFFGVFFFFSAALSILTVWGRMLPQNRFWHCCLFYRQ